MNKSVKLYNKLLWVTVFAIAMAFMESAVVVYLREIYYPEGFEFPLSPIDMHIAVTELLREAATIIMLIMIGVFAGKNFITGFAYFIYAFAIWDIYYYIFLKLILGWPERLLTWDILFLIPVTWVGPVIAPIILSLTMILLAISIIYFNRIEKRTLNRFEWYFLIVGSVILVFGFCLDYTVFLMEKYQFQDIFQLSGDAEFQAYLASYIPGEFNWTVFILGEILLLIGIGNYMYRNRKRLT